MKTFEVGKHKIGPDQRPFIIAEMSGNHNQSLERALEIVDEAGKAGAQALKIQTYTADTMTLNLEEKDFFIDDPESLWKGNSLHKLYQQAYTPWEWHKPIFERCQKYGMVAFSTPFDETAVDFLEELKVPAYKIASFENTDLKLIKKVAKTKKPMIISTGMATAAEIEEAVTVAKDNGCNNLVLLKCTSTYPASPKTSNLATIPHMRQLYNTQVGLSDHTLGIGVAVASIAFGATVIEKHFTIKRSDGGVDSTFSLEPHELKALVEETEKAWQAIGSVQYGTQDSEKGSLKFRRSLYIAKNIKKGEAFTPDNLRAVRPGFGLPVKYYDVFIGRKASRDLTAGTALTWDILI